MIIEDFEKKVLFWQVRGIYSNHNIEDSYPAFILELEDMRLRVTYRMRHGKCRIIMVDKTGLQDGIITSTQNISLTQFAKELKKI